MNKLMSLLTGSSAIRPLAYRLASAGWLEHHPLYHAIYAKRISSCQQRWLVHPRVVAIEGTNRCQAACVMCGHRSMRRSQGVMAWPLFQRLINQISQWPIESLLLSGFGEPLCDPDLTRRVACAKTSGIANVGIVTNAALLDPGMVRELTAAGLDTVHISLDGASREVYNQMRVNLDFATVAGNIDALLALPHRPTVIIQMVLFDQNRRDASVIRRRWGGRADRIVFRQAQDWAGKVALPKTGYTPHSKARASWHPCRYLWDQLTIYWDGCAPACHLDYEAQQPIGNASSQTLDAIWRGDALGELRRKHNAGERDALTLCRQCRYYSIWW